MGPNTKFFHRTIIPWKEGLPKVDGYTAFVGQTPTKRVKEFLHTLSVLSDIQINTMTIPLV